jgi:hydrogenase/urease accessory protein HupE
MSRRFAVPGRFLLGCGVVAIAVALCPTRAEAHLNSSGLGPVYDGLLHFFLSPEDLLPVLALSLYAGQQGTAFGRRVLVFLPVAWLLGGWSGLGQTAAASAIVSILSLLLMGGMLAAGAKLSLRWFPGIVLALGISHGYFNGAGMGKADAPGIVLLGTVTAVFMFVALSASFAVQVRRHWSRIALRVVGSWIAACGILLAGWAAHK